MWLLAGCEGACLRVFIGLAALSVQEVNEAIKGLHDSGQVSVVSFCEGLPLNLLGPMMPKMAVVPIETCYPGGHTSFPGQSRQHG
jgi:hypothetical protein